MSQRIKNIILAIVVIGSYCAVSTMDYQDEVSRHEVSE